MRYEEIYTKPESGIPEEHLNELVQNKLLPHEILTQEEYKAKVEANQIDNDVFYIITEGTGYDPVPFAGKIELVLRADDWSGSSAPYTQNLTVPNLKASSAGEFGLSHKATFAEREAARNASIMVTAQRNGGITVSADSAKPTIDIPCVLTVFLTSSSSDTGSSITTEYDNLKSGLSATTYQEAIDEIYGEKGVANGIATLDANGKVPESQLPELTNAATTANIIIKLTPVPPSETPKAILTGRISGTKLEQTFNSEGIAEFTVNTLEIFSVEYTSTNGTIISESNITISIFGSTQYVLATYIPRAIYTVKIDLNNSNPETCCTYMDDAVVMAKGSGDWDNAEIFKDIKPCIFNNGQVNYYLNKLDWNRKADGTPSNLTGIDGDYMVEFPKFAYRIYKDDNYLYVSITQNPDIIANDSRYHYYAFSRNTEGDRDYFYLGGFKGSLNSDGNLQSVSETTAAVSKTLAEFKTLANNRGNGYTITSYNQIVALQCLYLIKYGNLNGQAALGRGYVGSSGKIIPGRYSSPQMYYGSAEDTNQRIKFAGIEDFWGNIYEWVDGLTTNSSRDIITNTTISGNPVTTASGLASDSYGYITNVSGTTESGFIPVKFSGSSTTYFCDNGNLYADRVLSFGGHWSGGDYAGPFRLAALQAASDSYSSVGARLLYI